MCAHKILDVGWTLRDVAHVAHHTTNRLRLHGAASSLPQSTQRMHLYTMSIALKWTISGRAELNCTILTPNFVTTLIATANPDALGQK